MYDPDHHTVFFQIYVLLFIFPLYVALRDQYHEVHQAGWNEKPGIGALRVSPRHRHSLTLSAPMPHTLIVCVIYVDFCTGVSLCIASNSTCIDYLFYRVAHISRTHLGYWAWEHSV